MRNKSLKAVILMAGGILGLCLYFAGCDGKKLGEPDKEGLNISGVQYVIK